MGRLLRALRFWAASVNRHGVHSPFVFDLLEKGLRTRRGWPLLQRLQDYFGEGAIDVIEEGDLPSLLHNAQPDAAIFYLPDIHSSGTAFREWSAAAAHPSVKLSIEFWEGGLLFFSKEFKEKQHFLLRYKR